jgi:outer membrane protein assembly factor BamE (lipoprotein component of BamABCDE complex)
VSNLHSRRRSPAARFGGAAGLRARAGGLALVAAMLGGCTALSTYMPAIEQFGIYKLDINQGNFLAQDQVDKLRVGQTPQQVRSILGTPLIMSPFRPDRWDYVYEFKRQGKPLEQRNFAVYFVDAKLARWEGDEMPLSMAAVNRAMAAKTIRPDPSADDRGIFAWFWDLFPK